MKTYEVELDDGRVFEVDALEPPSHEDVLSRLGMGQEQSPMVDTGQGRASSMLGEAGRSVLSIPKGMVGGAGDILSLFPGMQENFLQDSADEIEKWYKGMIPVNPTLEQSFPVKASGAAGQGLGFLGTTLATAGLGATPAIARGVGLGTAGLMGADQGGDTADQYGMTDWNDRAASILGGAAIETGTEMMGGFGSKNFTESLLGAMKSATRPGNILTRGAKTVLGEGAEEVAAGQFQDWLASGLVDKDPERPGFALNGAALPPDTLSMQNLYNRLEEGALGAVGGAVFAGAEALGSRTPVNEALSLRMQAKTLLNDLQGKETLTPEEQTQLAQVQAEDANVSAWLERQGFQSVRPALEQIIQNPDVEESARVQAVEYASLIDNLSATEADAEASPEEIERARTAVDTHPLNGLNPLARTRQNNAITGAFEEKQKALSEEVDAYQKRQNLSRQLQSGAPVDPVEVQDVVVSDMEEQTKETAQQVALAAPATAQALEQIANESQDATTPTVQELAPVQEPSSETSPQATSRPPANTQPKLRKPKVRLGLSISPREVQRAVKKFEKISGVRVASVEELARDPQFRAGWERTSKDPSPEAWNKFVNEQLSTAEGLANDGQGQAVIIPENLAIYNTDQTRAKRNKTTAGEEAMLRVLSHENWHGVERWLDRDPSPEAKELQQRYHGLLNEISDTELNDMAQRRYTNLSDWRNDALTKRLLQSEVMAERRETAELTGEPDSLIEKFLAWLRDVFKAVTQSTENPTPDELQELFEAWYKARKTPTTGPPQASQPEQYSYPPRPEVTVAFTDWIPSVNQEQALQLAWESFYRDQVNQGMDPDQIAEAWAEEAENPDSYFVAQGMTDAFMEARKRPTEVYTPTPSQTAPETGDKQTRRKSKTPEPTAEDIARRFPQFSQQEMTPEQRVAAMEARAQSMSYETQAGQQEGLDPTKATSDQRQFADGTPVDFSRASTTRAGQQAQGRDDIQALTQLSPDGPSETFGKDLMDFLSGKTPTLYGYRGNEFSKLNMLNYLDSAVQDRAQLGIDGGEVQKIRSQYLSKAGATLQTAANSIYKPLQEIANKATEMTDTEAKKDLGTDDFKGLADTVNQAVVRETLPLAEEAVEPELVDSMADAAQAQADAAEFEAAISSLPPNEQKAVRDLLNELEELDELLRIEAELSAGQSGPAASRAEVRSQRLTLEEVRYKIAQKRKSITKLVEEIQKSKVEGDPVEAAKKAVNRVSKPKAKPPEQNSRLREWASGKLDVEGLGKPVKTIQKYIQGTGLNRDALFTILRNTFPEADPNFINGIVSRMGDLVDGVAAKEGILEDLKKGGGKPDPKLVEKMVRIAERARKARENAVKAMEKKLAKVKNPTPQKLKKRSTFVNSIMGAMETGILDSEAVRASFSEAYELHGLTNERLKSMGDLLQKIEAMREGITKETFLNRFNQILNEIAPTASFVTHAHSALMGYVLSGITTMGMQLTGINRYINPLAGTVEILWGAPGTTSQKVGRAINPANFFRLYLQGIREVGENFQQGIAGLSGVRTSAGKGLGASPSSLASVTPRETSLSYTPWGQISQYRFNTPKLLKTMGLDKMTQLTRYPAWMVSRSFQVIRAAEGIVGGADKNMQWRAQMTYALMQESPSLSFADAYSRVSDALGDKTTGMWQDAYKQADSEIAEGLVAKASRKQRATELAQDALEDKWQKNLANRSRELSALAGYKQDPITPLGAWVYKGVSGVLNKDKGAAKYLKFSFLFARFFSNALETAYSRTPLGGLSALMIDTTKPEGRMDEREKRIVQMFGSMQGYKDARMGRAISGTAVMGGLAGLMIMALKGWDPDDDEAPFFWITGDPLGEFSKKGSMEAGGWYKSNTLYIGPLRINYVNASPEYAMSMAAVGSIADRFMFDKLLNYRENKETGEYEHSGYEAYGKPVLEALAAPVSRSTFRQWYDMLEAAYDGNFTKITKALSNPVTGTAIALSPLALVPSIKTAEKYDRANEQPRSPQNPAQAAMGSVPFADELGLDAGKPLTTPFGNPLTPFPFWSIFSNSQEVPPEVSKAARTLTDLGVSRLGPREEYFGWGMAEIAHDGKKFLLGDEERSKVLQDIGSRFARKVNAESAKLRKIEAGAEGRKKVRSAITDLAAKARSEALMNYRSQKK